MPHLRHIAHYSAPQMVEQSTPDLPQTDEEISLLHPETTPPLSPVDPLIAEDC